MNILKNANIQNINKFINLVRTTTDDNDGDDDSYDK